MGFADDAPRAHFETREQWRAWLERNHSSHRGIFVVSWRTPTGRPAMTYAEMVEEALCFGWVDSRAARLDDERTALWFTPRRKGSGWSRPNKERIERLIGSARMQPAGQAMIDAAVADGSWTLLDSVERLEVPADLAAAFNAIPRAAERFTAMSRSAQRAALERIATAKTAPTRAKRVAEVAAAAAASASELS